MKQVGFYVNAAVCMGCKTCVIACKDQYDLEVGRNFRRVYNVEQGAYPRARHFHLSISCNHCDEPACVQKCPTKALYKRQEDGIVAIDEERCIGCHYCSWACPYDALQFNPQKGVMTKCGTCTDLRTLGAEPACVTSCPMRALEFGEISVLRKKYGSNADMFSLPSSKLTKPNIVIGLKKLEGS